MRWNISYPPNDHATYPRYAHPTTFIFSGVLFEFALGTALISSFSFTLITSTTTTDDERDRRQVYTDPLVHSPGRSFGFLARKKATKMKEVPQFSKNKNANRPPEFKQHLASADPQSAVCDVICVINHNTVLDRPNTYVCEIQWVVHWSPNKAPTVLSI